MPRKQLEVPPAVARSFVEDMRAYFAAKTSLEKDEIAARQIQALRLYQGTRERPIKIHEVKELFHAMKDHA